MTPEIKSMIENAARAAIAAGLPIRWHDALGQWFYGEELWNPYTDQADSDRMGIMLRIRIRYSDIDSRVEAVSPRSFCQTVVYTDDRCADVRLARLRVADQIGRAMV